MKKTFVTGLVFLSLVGVPYRGAQATFYGVIPRGYQFVEKGRSGYAVYIPQSFDPDKRSALLFVFGRNRSDFQLTKERMKEYLELWTEEAEKRGYIVVAPYWEPVVVEGNQHTEEFFLEILEEVKMMYNVQPTKVLIGGFGAGVFQAFSLAAFYPDRFNAVFAIAGSPLRDRVMRGLMSKRLVGGLPPRDLPPLLLIHGENDKVIPISWLEEDKAFLEKKGNRVDLVRIPGMGHEHDPKVNRLLLDWFDSLSQ